MRHLALALGFLAVVACSSSVEPASVHVVSSDYSQSCATADDCVAIATGPLCGPCAPCPDAAISATDAQRELQDERDLYLQCPLEAAAACGACGQVTLSCVAGLCQAAVQP